MIRNDEEPRELGAIVDALARQFGVAPHRFFQLICDEWTALVGVQLAQMCRPVMVKDHVLVIETHVPGVAERLNALARELAQRINTLADVEVVREVSVRVVRPR